MSKIRTKLKDNTGASLMAALLFFVMMAVIGSVILTAATAGMGRVKSEDSGNQERYALYSAANLVVNRFADQKAFSFLSDDGSVKVSTDQYTYYVDLDNGSQKCADAELKQPFDDSVIRWQEPSFKAASDSAGNLDDIRYLMAETILKKYWYGTDDSEDPAHPQGDIPSEWQEGDKPGWNRFIDSNEYETFTFDIDPDENWSKNAGLYKVKAVLTLNDDLTLTGTFTIDTDDLTDKEKENINDLVYYIKVPFSSTAAVLYDRTIEPDPPEEDTFTETITNDDQTITEIVHHRQTVNETRRVTFQNFKWQNADQAVISTLKEKIE